ncbi:hypothetical protein MHYP_G00317650 [Metynnis hypsauchen]
MLPEKDVFLSRSNRQESTCREESPRSPPGVEYKGRSEGASCLRTGLWTTKVNEDKQSQQHLSSGRRKHAAGGWVGGRGAARTVVTTMPVELSVSKRWHNFHSNPL